MKTAEAQSKEVELRELIASYGSLAVAYSGGVDSAYLSAIAHDVLGEKCRLILADSPSIPRSEVKDAVDLANDRNWNLTLIETNEFENDEYLKNDKRRCYFCKSALFEEMTSEGRNRR